MTRIQGLHHVTAISGPAWRNLEFYRDVLGLRFVKKTVNFDDPDTYHLYYGDRQGTPGTVMTFFPWERAARGVRGHGEVSATLFAVPPDSLDFWQARLAARSIHAIHDVRFGQKRLQFDDPDGTTLVLVETSNDRRTPWPHAEIAETQAIRGFLGVVLSVGTSEEASALDRLLRDLMDYEAAGKEGPCKAFVNRSGREATRIEVALRPDLPRASAGAGSVHHVAFSVADREVQRQMQQRLAGAGLQVTRPIDRDYFWAIYFRVPGGILFEIATDEPGFTIDEPLSELGTGLKLPAQHESRRKTLEVTLPPLT